MGRLLRALVEGADLRPDGSRASRASRAVSAFPHASPLGDNRTGGSADAELKARFATAVAQDFVAAMKLRPPSPFSTPLRSRALAGDLDVMLGGTTQMQMAELVAIGENATAWCVAGMALVLLCMVAHIGSLRLAALGMLQILASLPIALCLYSLFVPFTGSWSALAIYVVIGIGADDLFIFIDSWRLTIGEARASDACVDDAELTHQRLATTISRTRAALFTTSLSTALSFFSLAATPLPVLAALGMLAGIGIIVDFLLTLSLWPAMVLLAAPQVADGDRTPRWVTAREWWHRGMGEAFGAALGWSVPVPGSDTRRLKPVAPTLVLVFSTLALALSYHALQLPSPTGQEQFLPRDHMFSRAMRESEKRRSGLMALNVPGAIFVGLRDIDKRGVDRFAVDIGRGAVRWDESFDLADPATQQSLLRLVGKLREAPCDLHGCHPSLLAKPRSVRCVLEDWSAALNGSLPHGAAFEPALAQWVAGRGAADRELVGFENGRLRFVQIAFESTFQSMVNGHRDWLGLQQSLERFLAQELSDAPAAVRRSKVLLYRSVLNRRAGREELFDVAALMQLYPSLQSSLLRNLVLCISTCFVVLVLTIGSVRLAALATLCIASIVGSLLGCLQLAGWSLACSEMVGGTIVVGFSFDYTLHLSCCYCASPRRTREARIADAVRHVGPSPDSTQRSSPVSRLRAHRTTLQAAFCSPRVFLPQARRCSALR